MKYRDEILKLRYNCLEEHLHSYNIFQEGGEFSPTLKIKISIPMLDIWEIWNFTIEDERNREMLINEMYERLYKNLKKRLGIVK